MALDPYQSCLCGSGKKLKFCCGDFAPDLEKIDRMLQGEQFAAALKHLHAVTAKHPDRISLLGMQAMLETHQEDFEGARKTLNTLIVKQPENERGWAELAILEAVSNNGQAGVEPLQRAMEASSQEVPLRLYLAIGVVGQALLEQGEVCAARAHFALQASMAPEKDRRPSSMLMEINRSAEIPLLMKEDYLPPVPSADVPWKDEYIAGMKAALGGTWREAERKFTALAQKYPSEPTFWRAVAAMKANLADDAGAIEALRRFSRADVPLDDAVEAAALAIFLDPQDSEKTIDVLRVPRTLFDKEAVETALLSSDRVEAMPVDSRAFEGLDTPPPTALYVLFDKPIIKSAAGRTLALDDLPNAVGQAYLYGRETDREARLELVSQRNLFVEANAVLDEIAGSHLAQLGEESVLTSLSALQSVLSWRWRLPPDLSVEQRKALIEEKTRQTFLQAWTELPLHGLGGKTARAAASDPSLKIPLLAEILRLELATSNPKAFQFNELRREFGLPELGPVDPTTFVDRPIPLARLARVEVEKFTDTQLTNSFYTALMFEIHPAFNPLAVELEKRESCHKTIRLSTIYGILSSDRETVEEELLYLDKARVAAGQEGSSVGQWELRKLDVHLRENHVNEAKAALNRIRRHYMEEPGVGDRLFQLLVDYGIIGPDGRPVGPAPGTASILSAEQPAETAGGIWTPEGAASGGEKSKLWVPGMD
jgi:tetratricopeptide (TPR) repeat protein